MRNVDTIKRRAGKSLTITLSVSTDSKLISLVGRNIELSVHTPLGQYKKLDFEIIEDYKIKFNFREMRYGVYEFTVFENWDKEIGATAVDSEKAIELVPKTYMEGGTAPEGLDVESVDLGVLNMEVSIASPVPGTSEPITKESVERVLTGDITSHNHSTQIAAALSDALSNYVKKVAGKDLSSNDFTNALKQKLEGLENYNDKAVLGAIETINSRIDTLVGTSASEAIDTFNEIESFLTGITDSQSLTVMLSDLKREITALMPSVEGLASKDDVNGVENKIPTATSQLQNDSDFVKDASYVHTDNNFTTEDKNTLTKLNTQMGDISSLLDILNGEVV